MVQPVTTPTVPFNSPTQSQVAPRPAEQERSTGVRTFTSEAVNEPEEQESLQADEDDDTRFDLQASSDRQQQASTGNGFRGQTLDISV
jgi:hypothetical protein